jgi:hypothetical protein
MKVFDHRKAAIKAIILLVLTVFTGLNYARYDQSKNRAEAQAMMIAKLNGLESRIKELRNRYSYVVHGEMPLTELNRIIEKTVKKNNIPIHRIGQISQERSKRIDKSDFVKNRVKFNLRGVTMEALIRVLHELSVSETSMIVQNIHLKLDPNDEREFWSAEATLVYYIYSKMIDET